MISKIIYYNEEKRDTTDNTLNINIYVKGIYEYLELKGKKVEFKQLINDGTLGIVFSMKIDGRDKVVKTHLNNITIKNRFINECCIFKKIYGKTINIEILEIKIENCYYTYLVMDELSNDLKHVSIDLINKIISVYKDNFKEGFRNNIPNIRDILQRYNTGKKILLEKKLISKKNIKIIDSIDIIEKDICAEKLVFCHGDLSNKNIMQKDNENIVIDWEDSFFGVEKYDFIYWLTFMQNRKYYNEYYFKLYKLNNQRSLYLFVVILILKCYLSYINKTYVNNKVSFDDRLDEVFSLYYKLGVIK